MRVCVSEGVRETEWTDGFTRCFVVGRCVGESRLYY